MKRQKTSKKAESKILLLPAVEGWTLWEVLPNHLPVLKQNLAELSNFVKQEKAEKIILGFPVRQVFCFSLWLSTEDKTLLPDLIFTQLERRGLVTRSREETIFDYRVIATEAGKSLTLVAILPSQLPEVYLQNIAETYDVSARFYPLENNQLTLWREIGQLVIAITRNDELVHFQTLSASEINAATIQEMLCLYLELESQQIISEMHGVTLWGNFSNDEIQKIQNTFHITPKAEEMPTPCLPKQFFSLTPHTVREIQTLHAKEERNQKILKMALAGYGLFLGLWILQLLFFYGRVYLIHREVKKDASLVQSLKETATRWNALGTALQPDHYAAEVLYQCARLLPQEGVRFTLFEVNESGVVLRGEATSVAAASDFFEKLNKNDQLLAYQWQMPTPAILPNDTAQFQITGNSFNAPTQPQ
ncbi:MAG: hypothetical protein K1X66_07980 [Verrucomicrobiae bacterium]|nr:hypothetical protein [Verrucomicrobiae bacterium]